MPGSLNAQNGADAVVLVRVKRTTFEAQIMPVFGLFPE